MADAELQPGDDLLQELEESIPQGVPNATRFEPEVDPLEALLNESMSDVREREQYAKDVKARARNFHGMSKEEVDFCNSRMAAFEIARQWEPVEAIGVFTKFSCKNCGNYTVAFSRYMEHHQSRHVATTHRWVTVAKPNDNLVLDMGFVREDREVTTCEDCEQVSEEIELLPTLEEVIGT